MPRVLLQPFGNKDARKHYVDTVDKPVSIQKLQSFLPTDYISQLSVTINPEKVVAVWGVTPGKNDTNVSKWSRVNKGDVVLFYRDKAIQSSSVVIDKIRNKDLAADLWDYDNEGQTWEYIYFLGEVNKQHIHIEKFNKVAGYKSNFIIQGFNVLDEKKSDRIMEYFDLFSEVFIEDTSAQGLQEEVEEFIPETLNARVSQTVRKEQRVLRNYLFKGHTVKDCAICGKDYPVEFLVAAHVKKRSECTDEEMRDYRNIVVPMCKFGCDELYEKRYVGVNEDGVITKLRETSSEIVKDYISNFLNNKSFYWNESREKYFKWHRKLI